VGGKTTLGIKETEMRKLIIVALFFTLVGGAGAAVPITTGT